MSVTAELKAEVKSLIEEVNKTHRYSMSKIYNLSNKVFGKNESPQSCASCLIRKVRELTYWLDLQKEDVEVKAVKEEPKVKKRKEKKL